MVRMSILVVNVGSSSLKLDVVADDDTVLESAHLSSWDGDVVSIATIISRCAPAAVGHRVVHGGASFRQAQLLDGAAIESIEALSPLAPLHQPRALAGIHAAMDAAPHLPHVACFDTGFHSTLPDKAVLYAVPRDWIERLGVRRYGFHGLSHAYVAERAAAMLGKDAHELRIISCHLGSGASLCAIDHGESVDTTMGMTPLEGLVMGTRSGSIDPGIISWLHSEQRLPVSSIIEELELRSGLLGLAGSTDLDELLHSAEPHARQATEIYVHRLCAAIAAMAASMAGFDVLVFTGGVGENVPRLRGLVAHRLSFLGVQIDGDVNEGVEGDTDITAEDAVCSTLVVAAREDLRIAAETRAVLAVG